MISVTTRRGDFVKAMGSNERTTARKLPNDEPCEAEVDLAPRRFADVVRRAEQKPESVLKLPVAEIRIEGPPNAVDHQKGPLCGRVVLELRKGPSPAVRDRRHRSGNRDHARVETNVNAARGVLVEIHIESRTFWRQIHKRCGNA